MKEIELTDEIEKQISDEVDSWIKELIDNKEKVKTSAYQEWLINYINTHGFIDDDADGRYALSDEDNKNMDLVCSFVSYIEELASEQYVPYVDLNDNCFGYFLLNKCIYSFETVHGQGSFNYIKKVLGKPINTKAIVKV